MVGLPRASHHPQAALRMLDTWPGRRWNPTQSDVTGRGKIWQNNSSSHKGMASLTPVDEDTLLSPEEVTAQKEWDEEFQRRKEDLARQQLKSRERRRTVSDKMAELRDRWQGVERRRQLRSREGRTDNSSATLSIPASQTGSHTSNNTNSDINNNNDDSRETTNTSSGLNR